MFFCFLGFFLSFEEGDYTLQMSTMAGGPYSNKEGKKI